ncbi:intraflagellar transport-associated protein isoform X2 [Saccopteryx leptura]|uniref:intraflagellar transport-associated protein isoform X2 n=1 Tax=Saccopteryx leptura TaxID=249018 RepID=UPI00339BB3EF
MPAQISELDIMEEDQTIEDILDKFVNSHEQTYEEFLSTFTYLSKEDNVTERGAFGTNSSENIFTSKQFAYEKEPNDHHHLRDKAIFLRPTSQWSEIEEIVLDGGQKVGRSSEGDLKQVGEVKVDNFLAIEDLDMDEEIKPQVSKGSLLLPEEVEQAQDVSTRVLSHIPSVAQPLTPGGEPRPTEKAVDKQKDEILGDEVQPFQLDEEFDYDTVMLTPKFTPAGIDAIKELSKPKRGDVSTGLGEPRD